MVAGTLPAITKFRRNIHGNPGSKKAQDASAEMVKESICGKRQIFTNMV
jgi:hypothetical protein